MGSVKVTFRPNRRGVTAAGNSEKVYRELGKRLDRVQQEALAIYEPHRKTGAYGRGFRKKRARIGGMAALRLLNVDPKAMILEKGSGPHVILPKNAKALSWPGAKHPVARVNHPGTPALHIMRRALKAAGR